MTNTLPTVSTKKIINKFVYGEIRQMNVKGENMPLEYLALLQECSNLEDLVDAVDSYYDMRSRCSASQHILLCMDYEED
jgi:hypothetical protein